LKIYKNILVTALRKIGDTVIATAGINLLKQYYPECKLTVLVTPLAKEIVENHPLVDEVMIYDYKGKAKWKEIWHLASDIRSRHFDLYLSLDGRHSGGGLLF
jgi:ADP-heptose:LPS heptosyltransferase